MERLTRQRMYSCPKVLSHQLIQFETCHSWNRGQGYCPDSDGNGGKNYPQPPFTGTHHGGNGGGQGNDGGPLGHNN